MTKYIFASILLCLYVAQALSQPTRSAGDLEETIESYTCKDNSLKSIFSYLDEETSYNFLYNPEDLEGTKLSLDFENVTITSALSTIAKSSNLIIKIKDKDVVIYKSDELKKRPQNVDTYTLSGYIYDKENSESLIGATVYDIHTGTGTTTNEYGFFSLSLAAGQVSLVSSYLGYHEQLTEVTLSSNKELTIQLETSENEIQEIVINAVGSNPNYKKTQMSEHAIAIDKLEAIPVVLGEEDIMKSIQLLPGIKSGTEGTSGIYVRGGSQDQNLILLDGVPVYNPAHALGIFSVFNSDALKSVNVLKAGHPARYGGRLSSVIDVRMKEGNLTEWNGEGSLGLISSKATVSGPIIKDKLSILASARRTYADVILTPLLQSESKQDIDPSLFFHDFNGKLQYKINNKHRLYLSGYTGKDRFGATFTDSGLIQKSLFDWGNAISVLRWNYEISPKLYSNLQSIRNYND